MSGALNRKISRELGRVAADGSAVTIALANIMDAIYEAHSAHPVTEDEVERVWPDTQSVKNALDAWRDIQGTGSHPTSGPSTDRFAMRAALLASRPPNAMNPVAAKEINRAMDTIYGSHLNAYVPLDAVKKLLADFLANRGAVK